MAGRVVPYAYGIKAAVHIRETLNIEILCFITLMKTHGPPYMR